MNQSIRTDNALTAFSKIIILVLLLVAPALNADAKWWIFGKSDAGVSTRYIYLNDLSYDELGNKVTLYRESLPQGKIFIRGKGTAGKNRIGAVQISIDGKQSWQKAKVTSNGSFLYSFTPESDRTYELYVKVLDTTGKSNDVDASRKELVISDENMQDQVYKTLDQLVKAYQDEDSFAFMRLVSDQFVSGTEVLDSAIRQDFTAFDNISLNYTLNNVARAADGNLFVAISYNRMVTSSRSGETFSDHASTEFTFKLENGTPKIYSMKNPLIFGLSDAGEVATGTINSGENNQVLSVDDSGNIRLIPLGNIPGDGEGSLPLPTSLAVTNLTTWHSISLSFAVSPNIVGTPDYEMVLEEALSGSGPWAEVYRHVLDSTTISALVTDRIRFGYGPFLYYRIILEKVSDGSRSLPSNVVSVDNRPTG
ncbi:MAG: hypothetical protein GXP51_01565 [Deltaproteobacteria bacterium]|nr:hypothetical protein [Deltaproteobacteria bacterium]